jgi:hypothetical protein
VDLLVTFDPYRQKPIPTNAARAINYYQSGGWGLALVGRRNPRQHIHCALMFAARITLAHFSVSSAMSWPKSAGDPGSTVPPQSLEPAVSVSPPR